MQRAAASDTNRTPSISSPLPASPQYDGGHFAKRQKASSSIPAFPSPSPSVPRPFYQSDSPSTPVSQEKSQNYTSHHHGGNVTETPWVLHILRSTDERHDPSTPLEYTSPPDAVIGRRIFGNYKKKSAQKMARTEDGDPAGSLSSADSDENYEQYEKNYGAKPTGKRRQDQDDDKIDRIDLKKLKSGGISASSGMRQPGSDGRKYKKDKRKGH